MSVGLAVILLLTFLPGSHAFNFEKCEATCKKKYNVEVNHWDAPAYAACMTDCALRYADAQQNGESDDKDEM
jgi:hypothetical protein